MTNYQKILSDLDATCGCTNAAAAAAVAIRELLAERDGHTPLTDDQVEAGLKAACMHSTPESRKDMRRAIEAAAHHVSAPSLDQIDGDMLPPIGSSVLIHLGRQDAWVKHTVTGYYVWGDLDGAKNLHRVFVRVVDDEGYPNARMLADVRRVKAPIEAELAGAAS